MVNWSEYCDKVRAVVEESKEVKIDGVELLKQIANLQRYDTVYYGYEGYIGRDNSGDYLDRDTVLELLADFIKQQE